MMATASVKAHAIDVKRHRYSPQHGKKITLCLPEKDQANIKAEPFILFVHGGAWTTGFGSSRAFKSHCKYSAQTGYASANLDYRLAPRHPYPAAYNDLKDAIQWLYRYINVYNATHGRQFSNKILLIGHSAGAHLSLLVAFREPTLPLYGVIDLAGPTDLTRKSSCRVCQFAKDWFVRDESLWSVSPVSWVRRDAPPVFIFHGENDRVVDIEQSYALRDRMMALGAPVQMMILEKTGHWFPYRDRRLQVARQAMDYVMKTYHEMDARNRVPTPVPVGYKDYEPSNLELTSLQH